MRLTIPPLVFASLLTLGCGDTESTDETGVSETDGGSETGDPASVTLTGVTTDFASDVGVPMVDICVRDHPEFECAQSDAMGSFSVDVPFDTDVVLDLGREDYMTTAYHGHFIVDEDDFEFLVPTSDTMALLVSQAGETIDDTKGHVAVGGPEGATDADTIPDTSLTEMSSRGLVGIANVDPGELTITVNHPTLTCSYPAWPTEDGTSYRVQVDAMTVISASNIPCE
jgi:hypothetical protein